MPTHPAASKRAYLDWLQCEKRAHLARHAPELAGEVSSGLEAILEQGSEVGRAAHGLFPGGVLVDTEGITHEAAAARTRALLEDASVPAIFEGAFEHAGVRIRSDVLERRPDGRFVLCEVKSATRPRPEHEPDLAIQLWVLRGAGVDVADCELVHVNSRFVRNEGPIDWSAFFARRPCTERIVARLDAVARHVPALLRTLAEARPPPVEPGAHCRKPRACEFWSHCTASKPPAFFLRHVRPPADVRRRWLRAAEEERSWISPRLGDLLAPASPPVWHLDFEALLPAIPLYPGTRPYQAVAFQWSLHRLEADGRTRHRELLADGRADPRREVAEGLLAALGGGDEPIVVYSPYESRMLRDMARRHPDLADALGELDARLFDLLPVARSGLYHPAFHGSFSLKVVAPILAPHVAYDDLEEIAEGTAAAGAFVRLASGEADAQEEARLRRALLAYCERDTLALMEVHRALRKLAGLEA